MGADEKLSLGAASRGSTPAGTRRGWRSDRRTDHLQRGRRGIEIVPRARWIGPGVWQRLGGKTAIISGRTSKAVDIRAAELGISLVIQGSIDKRADLGRVLKRLAVVQARRARSATICRICRCCVRAVWRRQSPMPAPK